MQSKTSSHTIHYARRLLDDSSRWDLNIEQPLNFFFQEMYRTTQPFDPEGILGTINSVVMGFLGMQVRWIVARLCFIQQVVQELFCSYIFL